MKITLILSLWTAVLLAGIWIFLYDKNFPEFSRCSCDSGTFCLDDQDVMKLHMWKSMDKRRD
jgi:hypothetical protein